MKNTTMKIYVCKGTGYSEDTGKNIKINTLVRASDDMDAYEKFNLWCMKNGIEPEQFGINEQK